LTHRIRKSGKDAASSAICLWKKDPQLEGIFTWLGRNECFGFAERTRHVRLPTMSPCGMMIYDVNDVAVRHGINN
jgi:hypothetical protein